MTMTTEHRAERSAISPAPVLSTQRKRLSMDDRMDIAISAASRDNRNKPVMLPMLAVLLLVVSALYAAVAFWQLSSAQRTEIHNARWAGELRTLLNRYTALVEANNGSQTVQDVYARADGFRSTMGDLWSQVGLENRAPDAKERTTSVGKAESGLVDLRMTYNKFTTREIGPALQWIQRGLEQFPGTELSQLELTVQPNQGWQVAVEFRRVQRK